MTMMWDQFYRKWKLDSIPGRTLLTADPSTRITGPSGIHWQWEMACWSATGSRLIDGPWQPKIDLPQSKVKKYWKSFMEALREDIWVSTKPWIRLEKGYYWLHTRGDVERWSQQCGTSAACRSPQTRNLRHQYNCMALFENHQGQDAGLLQVTRPLHRILGRGPSLVLLPDMD
jgi:hypothetical protein